MATVEGSYADAGLTVSVLLMESPILSEVHNTSILGTGSTPTMPSSRLHWLLELSPASPLAAYAAGLERSDFVLLRKAAIRSGPADESPSSLKSNSQSPRLAMPSRTEAPTGC